MTREEAIDQLQDAKDGYQEYLSAEALDMAIKALEQEPRKDEVILTNKEYRELISNEYEHGYCKGYAEALEGQEPILDKIRAEIKDYFSITCDGNCDNCNRVVKNPCGESVDGAWVLHIIDKYEADTEVEDG